MEHTIEANEPVRLENRLIPFTISESSTLDIIEPIPFDQLPNIIDICDNWGQPVLGIFCLVTWQIDHLITYDLLISEINSSIKHHVN